MRSITIAALLAATFLSTSVFARQFCTPECNCDEQCEQTVECTPECLEFNLLMETPQGGLTQVETVCTNDDDNANTVILRAGNWSTRLKLLTPKTWCKNKVVNVAADGSFSEPIGFKRGDIEALAYNMTNLTNWVILPEPTLYQHDSHWAYVVRFPWSGVKGKPKMSIKWEGIHIQRPRGCDCNVWKGRFQERTPHYWTKMSF